MGTTCSSSRWAHGVALLVDGDGGLQRSARRRRKRKRPVAGERRAYESPISKLLTQGPGQRNIENCIIDSLFRDRMSCRWARETDARSHPELTYCSRRVSTKSSPLEPKRADWLPSVEPRTATAARPMPFNSLAILGT